MHGQKVVHLTHFQVWNIGSVQARLSAHTDSRNSRTQLQWLNWEREEGWGVAWSSLYTPFLWEEPSLIRYRFIFSRMFYLHCAHRCTYQVYTHVLVGYVAILYICSKKNLVCEIWILESKLWNCTINSRLPWGGTQKSFMEGERSPGFFSELSQEIDQWECSYFPEFLESREFTSSNYVSEYGLGRSHNTSDKSVLIYFSTYISYLAESV